MGGKILSQATEECQLVWYVSQFQVAYFLVLHWHVKKFISSIDHSAVILIVGWKTLNISINFYKEPSSCSQKNNVSSIYLPHMPGCSFMSSKTFCWGSAINTTPCLSFAAESTLESFPGENLVPKITFRWKAFGIFTSATIFRNLHYVKSVQIRSFFWSVFFLLSTWCAAASRLDQGNSW